MSSGYLDIQTYYYLNFNLMHNHKWSLTEIDSLYPFERDIYVEMLNAQIEEIERKSREGNGTDPNI